MATRRFGFRLEHLSDQFRSGRVNVGMIPLVNVGLADFGF